DAVVLHDLARDAPGELDRVAVDALRVLAGAVVLRLERTSERTDGLAVGRLQQPPLPALELEQVPQVARVEQELLLRPLLPARAERQRVEPGRDALDDREELERAERL